MFYWYNRKGGFVTALFYGFIYWLLGANESKEEDLFTRKLIFSGNRDRFEYVMHTLKPEITELSHIRGAGLKSIGAYIDFFDQLLRLLHEKQDIQGNELLKEAQKVLTTVTGREISNVTPVISNRRSAKNTSIETEGKINRLFEKNHRCPICEGHIDWKRYHQMEHLVPYKNKPQTTPDGTMEAHQFCNNNGAAIISYRKDHNKLKLPAINQQESVQQLGLFDLGEDNDDEKQAFIAFPDAGVDE